MNRKESSIPVNVHAAKIQFSRLLARVEEGEEIIIARAGRPIAKLVPVAQPPEPRVPGQDAGQVWVAENFDDPLSLS
jgi:prevent-host-death family protein